MNAEQLAEFQTLQRRMEELSAAALGPANPRRAIEVRGEQIPVLETFGEVEWKAFLTQEETARIQSLGEVDYKLVSPIHQGGTVILD